MKSRNKIVSRWTRFVIILILVLLLVVLGMKSFDFGRSLFAVQGMEAEPGTDVTITIPEGAGKSEVADILKKNGLIASKSTFNIQCLIFEAQFYPGDYTLNTSQGPEEIIDQLKINGAQ
ncbi:endolytic transglycosylase MltG [Parasporobacterium paucivorans]|uniref:UPF0755 protein n=1 Tax=Parasporobacterium paucivorans DSM 15970 TaxID=1122934 RepID=A0A1M6BZC3_9FIRM|nr:endolytic transglycosylase MltG [Parasporobacterium paucivorans]SHI54149.1 UPF0755 protein [Parasporobacterium paucivorans DSM 15970]